MVREIKAFSNLPHFKCAPRSAMLPAIFNSPMQREVWHGLGTSSAGVVRSLMQVRLKIKKGRRTDFFYDEDGLSSLVCP